MTLVESVCRQTCRYFTASFGTSWSRYTVEENVGNLCGEEPLEWLVKFDGLQPHGTKCNSLLGGQSAKVCGEGLRSSRRQQLSRKRSGVLSVFDQDCPIDQDRLNPDWPLHDAPAAARHVIEPFPRFCLDRVWVKYH